jgi:hypothetical protein
MQDEQAASITNPAAGLHSVLSRLTKLSSSDSAISIYYFISFQPYLYTKQDATCATNQYFTSSAITGGVSSYRLASRKVAEASRFFPRRPSFGFHHTTTSRIFLWK